MDDGSLGRSGRQYAGLVLALVALGAAVVGGTWWWMESDRESAKEQAKAFCTSQTLGTPMTWKAIQPRGPFWPSSKDRNDAFWKQKGSAKESDAVPDGEYVALVTEARWASGSCTALVARGRVVKLNADVGEGPLK